jgi:hypothetical protein
VVGVRLIQTNQSHGASRPSEDGEIPDGTPSLRLGLIGFGLPALGLVIVTPWMVRSSAEIAEITGLGTTFVGTTLVAIVTSLPELVTTIAAVKMVADDMAIGNLFGSNLFNMFALGLTDVFYVQGRFLGVIDPAFLLVGMLGLLMTGLGLIGNLARLERRVLFIRTGRIGIDNNVFRWTVDALQPGDNSMNTIIDLTISDLVEACRKPGYPVCHLQQGVVEQYLKDLFETRFHNSDVRSLLRASKGFCKEHSWLASTLGLGEHLRSRHYPPRPVVECM